MGEAGCKARARGTGRAAVLPQAPLEQRRACRCVYDALGVQRGQQAAQGGRAPVPARGHAAELDRLDAHILELLGQALLSGGAESVGRRGGA